MAVVQTFKKSDVVTVSYEDAHKEITKDLASQNLYIQDVYPEVPEGFQLCDTNCGNDKLPYLYLRYRGCFFCTYQCIRNFNGKFPE